MNGGVSQAAQSVKEQKLGEAIVDLYDITSALENAVFGEKLKGEEPIPQPTNKIVGARNAINDIVSRLKEVQQELAFL